MLITILICIICILGLFMFANFHCYTACSLDNEKAWEKWKAWKKHLESNRFKVELVGIRQYGTHIDFYYTCKKIKPQK